MVQVLLRSRVRGAVLSVTGLPEEDRLVGNRRDLRGILTPPLGRKRADGPLWSWFFGDSG